MSTRGFLCILTGVAAATCTLAALSATIVTRTTTDPFPVIARPVLLVGANSDTPSVIDVGTIAAGGSAESELTLTNSTDVPISIARVRTSCECVSVVPSASRIESHKTQKVVAHIDLSDEPDFTGGLGPDIEFLDAAQQTRFRFTLRAAVRPPVAPTSTITRATLTPKRP
jgi:hypothetical protein